MTRIVRPKYAPFYDLFKLIVAVILTIILIVLLLLNRQDSPALPTLTVVSSPVAIKSVTPFPATATNTVQPPSPTVLPPTATSAPDTENTTPNPEIAGASEPGQTVTPTSSPQGVSTSSPTSLPAPTEPVFTSGQNGCPSVSSRIQVGDRLRVLSWLNFRTGPGLHRTIILTNGPGTILQVIGGPACIPLSFPEGPRAYLWWNLRMEDGREGWSAEAPLSNPGYFLEPIHNTGSRHKFYAFRKSNLYMR